MKPLCLMLCLLVSLSAQAARKKQPGKAGEARILYRGSFHGDEVTATDGEPWFAVVKAGKSFEVRAGKISVLKQKDELVDGKDQQTGKKVDWKENGAESSDELDIVFLVSGVAGIKAGALSPIEYDGGPEPVELTVGKPVRFSEAGGKTKGLLMSYGQFTKPEPLPKNLNAVLPMLTGYSILYYAGKEKDEDQIPQELYSRPQAPDSTDAGYYHVKWAGDLDGDGGLDLLIEDADHYNVGSQTLWISQPKDGKAPLKAVAKLRTTGC